MELETLLKTKPKIIFQDGKAKEVILDIQDLEEILERLEDLEDLNMLKEMKKIPQDFRRLDEVLEEFGIHG